MTLVIVRLRFTLFRNLLRSQPGGLAPGLGVTYGLSVLFGLGAFISLFQLRGATGSIREGIVLLVGSLLFLSWVVGPLMTMGLDATLDPSRLVQYPLTSFQITRGLFAASLVGSGGTFSVFVALGLVGAAAPTDLSAVVALISAVALVAVSVAAGRAAAAAISAASRRLRDFLMFLGPVLFMVPAVIPSLLNLGEGDRAAPDFGNLTGAAQGFANVLPSGPALRSLIAVAEGRGVEAVAWLAGAGAWIAVLVLLWALALRRSLVRVVSALPVSAKGGAAGSVAVYFGRALSLLPRTRVGAVAVKDLRLFWRDPRQRVALLGSLFGGLPAVFAFAGTAGRAAVLAVCGPAYFVASWSTNLYGFDAGSHWVNVAAGDDARADLAGKCLARLIIIGSVVVVLGTAASVITGGWTYLLPAFALSGAAAGLGLGAATWVSVSYPWPVPPATKGGLYSGLGSGQGLQAIGPMIAMMFVAGIVIGPLGIGIAVMNENLAWSMGLSALAVVIGFGAFRIGFGRAVRLSADRQPELLLALTKA